MERLKLTCGRYLPRLGENAEARLAALEDYVGKLTAELEFRLGEAGLALERLETSAAVQVREEDDS